MSTIIITDGACDLPPSALHDYPIHTIPHRVHFGTETYVSGVTMNLDQFAKRLKQGDVHPTTSHPTAEEFVETYKAATADGSSVLSIHLSANLSSTYQTACKAAKELPDRSITVWDARTVSCTLGLQVLTAARAAKAGCTVEQITPLLEQTHTAANFLFCLDDISYLVHGGRIGKVSYYVAQTLRIKPIITVSKTGDTAGTYIPTQDRVHSLAKAVDVYVHEIASVVPPKGKLRVVVAYGIDDTQELAQKLMSRLEERFEIVYMEATTTTPSLCVHVGPRALAIGYVPGDWPI
jgi:DegV family protein with EDD domain